MALAYVQPDGVSHHRIIFNKDGKILLNDNFLSSMDCSTPRVGIEGNMSTSGSVALPKEEDVFDNLQSLVESYSRKYCWKVYNNSLINGVFFLCGISPAGAMEKVSSSHPGTTIVYISTEEDSFLKAVYHRQPTDPDYEVEKTRIVNIRRVVGGLKILGESREKVYKSIDELVYDHPDLRYNWTPTKVQQSRS
eukprot:TRINITY_DN3758_c0_g2_i17.p1 TRINITY_DN3758_c0_g2~~TRINITY_DN3758_c0_g2_i17.p1  ORF type:complete len:193 (+),score=36.79 TRINITY_DN3758_c0_g2_i17:3-581(+)